MKRPILASVGLGGLFLAVLSGCNQATLMKKMTPQEDEGITRRYVDDLRQNRLDQIEQDLDPGLKDSNMHGTLASMAAMFPAQEPVSTKVVGFRSFLGNVRRIEITLEYEFPQKWLLAEVVTQKSGGVTTIVGFHVTPIADSLENLNRFTLVGKGATHYAILSLAVLAPLFSLYVFVLCIKTRMGKKKMALVDLHSSRHRQACRQLDNRAGLFYSASDSTAGRRSKCSTLWPLAGLRVDTIRGNHIPEYAKETCWTGSTNSTGRSRHATTSARHCWREIAISLTTRSMSANAC